MSKKKKSRFNPNPKLKIEEILLDSRNLFLYESVTNESVLRLIKEIKTLDSLNKKPIYLWINSGGGCCAAGFALINVMRSVKSKIITIINAEVCSMGSAISINGNERWIVKNGCAMFHDMSGGIRGDYSLKVKDRAVFIEEYYKLLEENTRKNTKLTEEEIQRARTGELWLFAKDCLKKGIVDKII